MRAVVTGDTHLNAKPYKAVESFYGLWQAFQIAQARNLPLVHLGDMFDSTRPSSSTCSVLQRVARNFDSTKIFYILGNHDKTDNPWQETILKNAEHLPSNVGLDYTSEPDEVIRFIKTSACPVVCVHAFIGDILPSSTIPIESISPSPTVLSGHFHVPCQIEAPGAKVVYVGSSHQVVKFREPEASFIAHPTNNKRVLVVDFETGEMEGIELQTRQYVTVIALEDIKVPDTIGEPVSLPPALSILTGVKALRPFVRVVYSDKYTPADVHDLFDERLTILETMPAPVSKKAVDSEFWSLEDVLCEYLPAGDARSFVESLVQNPEDAVSDLRKQFEVD